MVKAVATVDAAPDKVWKTIQNGNVKMSGLKERREVGTCGQGCELIYVRLGNLLIDDRHYVVKMQTAEEAADGGSRYTRNWAKVDRNSALEGKDAVDIRNIRGSWSAEPIDGGTKTKLTYINHLDLGGMIPASFFAPKFVSKTYDIISKIKKNV